MCQLIQLSWCFCRIDIIIARCVNQKHLLRHRIDRSQQVHITPARLQGKTSRIRTTDINDKRILRNAARCLWLILHQSLLLLLFFYNLIFIEYTHLFLKIRIFLFVRQNADICFVQYDCTNFFSVKCIHHVIDVLIGTRYNLRTI